jgi:hypothetical protein
MRNGEWRFLHSALFLALFLFDCGMASAQRLIVVTTPLTATHEATGVRVQSVDMGAGAALPGFEALPGTAPTSRFFSLAEGEGAMLSTGFGHAPLGGTRAQGPCHLVGFRTAPFKRTAEIEFPAGWDEFAGCPLENRSSIVALGSRASDTPAAQEGRLDLYQYETDPVRGTGFSLGSRAQPATLKGVQGTLKSWELPGSPVAAVPLPGSNRVAVLCRGPLGNGAMLVIVDLQSEGVSEATQELDQAGGVEPTAPSGLAVTRDGAHLLVLTSGYAVDPPSGEAVSWLRALDTTDFEKRVEPLTIPGATQAWDQPLLPTGDGGCCVVTRTPGTDLAYVTRVRVTPTETATQLQLPLIGVSAPVQVASDPAGDDLAVGIENCLEIWSDGHRGGPSQTYEAPVAAVRWTSEGLFAAESGRVHQVDPKSGATMKTVQLQTGWVADMIVIPAEHVPTPDPDADGLTTDEEIRLGTSPDSPDTDADDIPDGSDPDPLVPSPRLRLPDEVVFHEEAVGCEVKGIKINPDFADDYLWRVDFDRKEMPWLVIHPLSDKAPSVIYLGVDPGRYYPGRKTTGRLTIDLSRADGSMHAADSPAIVDVRILPERRYGVRRILWIWEHGGAVESFRDASDPHHLRALGDMLAGPPYHFTHREAEAPIQEDLDSYAVVVLNVAAAAQGALTRQSLLRYVVDGGALLLLGGFAPTQADPDLDNWLSPLGIHLDPSVKTDGAFNALDRHPILRHISTLRFTDGCAVNADDPTRVLVPAESGGHRAALLASTYGRGRIVVLASPTPLETNAMTDHANQLFAADLFQWLAEGGAGAQEQDMDSDRLSDSLEDRNGNGIVDPGETDYLDPDTDGDGLPDGIEDANLNGVVDEGETSPLNPDSDGDGIFDGADPTPVPPVGTPMVAEVSPTQAPSEGGVQALVSGRNFAPDAIVWFGSRQASMVRVMQSTAALVEVPPCEIRAGGDVPVRVVNSSTGQEGALPKGFHYLPRSTVSVVLRTLRVFSSQARMYEGSLSVRIDPPPGVSPDKILLLLRSEPAEGFQWGELPAVGRSHGNVGPVIYRRTRLGDLHIVALSVKSTSELSIELGPIPWKYAAPAKVKSGVLRVSVIEPRILARNGQPLDVDLRNVDIDLQAVKPKNAAANAQGP